MFFSVTSDEIFSSSQHFSAASQVLCFIFVQNCMLAFARERYKSRCTELSICKVLFFFQF